MKKKVIMNKNFIQATLQSLPYVNLNMLIHYISTNDCFKSVETEEIKILRSMRPNCGDAAIGYVQLLREENLCTVEAKVCPEHKTHQSNYAVQIIIDEEKEVVVKAQCISCAASLGGCKHAVALLSWIYRRSEEASPTSVICYWKKPLLSGVGTSIKYKEIHEIAKYQKKVDENDTEDQETNAENINCDFLTAILNHESAKNSNSHLIHVFHKTDVHKLSLHYNAVTFNGDKNNYNEFLQFCTMNMSNEVCLQAAKETTDQNKNALWFELRYGRVTASTVYDAAHCQTYDGSLVEKILSNKNINSLPLLRGKELEEQVLAVVERHLKRKYDETVTRTGLLLDKKYPALGASPDSITEKSVIEIKCPFKEKTVARYFCNGKMNAKHEAQIQMQMFFANKQIGYFCIEDPDFEQNKKVMIIKLVFNENFIKAVMKRAMIFWENAVFKNLLK